MYLNAIYAHIVSIYKEKSPIMCHLYVIVLDHLAFINILAEHLIMLLLIINLRQICVIYVM